jgi:MYXO-CTERM domain-containing protein
MAPDPVEAQRAIEQTREELARAVDALADKVDPRPKVRRRIDAVRSGDPKTIGIGLAALAAFGGLIAWRVTRRHDD